MLFGHDLSFWLAVLAATLIKLFTSQYHSLFRSAVMVGTALFCAVVFADPVVDWLKLDSDTYKVAVGALLAMTGEGLLRLLLGWVDSPQKLIDLVRSWRGK